VPTRVFVSYCHADRTSLDRLLVHLKPLEKAGLVDRWDDTKITTGMRWKDEIKTALASAGVAVLLVSADFLASDFITTEELPKLLAAEKKRGLVVMPVIVGTCRFNRTPSLSQFQAANDPKTPLNKMEQADQEAVWDKLADEIEDLIKRP
jgi:TIR domain